VERTAAYNRVFPVIGLMLMVAMVGSVAVHRIRTRTGYEVTGTMEMETVSTSDGL